jgi:hypothetical protein
MGEEIGFNDEGSIEIPDKGDMKTEAIVDQTKTKILREQIEGEVRQETGTEKEKPKTPIPADVPKLCFRMVAKYIECPKFEIDDDEARTIAHHLTILIPIEGKLISVIVILMVVVNKVIVCMDAIKRKMQGDVKDDLKPGDKANPDLPELIK